MPDRRMGSSDGFSCTSCSILARAVSSIARHRLHSCVVWVRWRAVIVPERVYPPRPQERLVANRPSRARLLPASANPEMTNGVWPEDGAWPALRWVAGGRGVERESQQSVGDVRAVRAEQGATRIRSSGVPVATREGVPGAATLSGVGPRGPPLPGLPRIASLPAKRPVARDDGVETAVRGRRSGVGARLTPVASSTDVTGRRRTRLLRRRGRRTRR